MLKSTFFAGLVVLASAMPALANDGYYDDYVDARVVRVEPRVSFSYSTFGSDDAFRIQYEWGGNRYWTDAPRHPGSWVRVRPPRVINNYYYSPPYRYDRSHEFYQDHRHDWRHDRRDHWRHEHRRGHSRHDD